MYPCTNRHRGCAELFQRRFGLQIHLRSCIHKRTNVAATRKVLIPEIPAVEKEISDVSLPIPYEEQEQLEKVNSILDNSQVEYDDEFVLDDIVKLLGGTPKRSTNELSAIDNIMLKLGHLSRVAGRQAVSELIQFLSRNDFCMDTFRTRCAKAKDCIQFENQVVSSEMNDHGFNLIVVKDPDSGIECDIYLRSPIEFLKKQINGCSRETAVFNPSEEDYNNNISGPMCAGLGKEGVPVVINSIMSRLDDETLWYDGNGDNGFSFVGMLQLYSDKSRTTLKESAFQFYPLHITLLNFSEEYRRQCIVNGLSLVAFLPVMFYRYINGERIKIGLTRMERLNMLHISISRILSGLKEVAYKGFNCVDKEQVNRVCHPCIGSYCCDLPEGKDLTSVKNGNSSRRNCHRCMAETSTFNVYSKETKRNGTESTHIIRTAMQLRKESKTREANDLLHQHSLVEQVSCLQEFPFMGSTDVLDMHSVFNFEPLHNFHLGVSKDMKRCLSARLRSEDLFSSSLPTKGGKKRNASFKTLRLTILSGINRMLSHIQTHSPAKGLKIDFSTSGKASYGSGLYVEEGKLVGMLEAKDYKAIDMVSPFIGMLADRCCDEEDTAPTTTLYVQYVEIMQMAMSYNANASSWTEESICSLEKQLISFKKNALELYGTHHPSTLCTEKFHLLDHIPDDIRRMGGLISGDAGLYEHEHTDIKRANRSGSRKVHTAMAETVSAYVKEKYHRTRKETQVQIHPLAVRTPISASSRAMQHDSAFLIKTGHSFSIRNLDEGRRLVRQIRIEEQAENSVKVGELKRRLSIMDGSILHILQDIGEMGCRILLKELKDKLSKNGTLDVNSNAVLTRVASGFVSGIQAPSIEHYEKRWNRIRVKPSLSRWCRRIISCRGFSGSSILRQDNVLIQASDPSLSGGFSLWVGKVLGLFRTPHRREDNSSADEDNEFAFVQFYELSPPKDNVDKALGCIRLVWATAQDRDCDLSSVAEENVQSVSPWYTLIPVSSIRGTVHVVRGDYGIDGVGLVTDMDSVPWHEQHFYINRFYFDPDNQRYERKEE